MSSPEPPANRKPKRPRSRIAIELEPLAARLQVQPWFAWLLSEIKRGGRGLVVSMVLHGVLLASLTFIAFQPRSSGDGGAISATWMPPSLRPAATPRKKFELPMQEEVEFESPVPTQKIAKPTTPIGDAAGTAAPGVSPVSVGQALGGRSGRTREGNLESLGGSPDAEASIKMGLLWLKRQQKSDGRWELHQGYPDAGLSTIKTDTGATALALLAFLGHGHTHQTGDHATVVAKGLKWLRSQQDPATGDLHDQRQEEGRQPALYAHAMATIALCEALALTDDNELKPSAEQAVRYLLTAQHPIVGGWKYRVLIRESRGDLSVTGWALMALHTARMAGIEIAPGEFERASLFLDSVQAAGSARYKYEPSSPDNKATAALTAEALLCRQWLGWPRTFQQMTAGVKYVMAEENSPSWSDGRRNVYGWYYTSQMLHNLGGDDWKRWNLAVRDAIVRNQVTGGTAKPGLDTRGSWNPISPRGQGEEYADKAGRLYLTALCILTLETPYRHQPIYPPVEAP
ncbi:MAG: hypothetical protein NTZ32_08315 [Planctomycetales bacterium]|nr:hypothetical protein [Planctomycetales bacterium]